MSFIKGYFSTNKDVWKLLILAVFPAVFFIPELASAAGAASTEATTIINDGFDLGKLFMKALVYVIMAAMFVVFMWVLLKSYLDWKDDSKKDASAGGILVTLVLGLMVMGIVFTVGEKAIKYIDDKVKITAIETPAPERVIAHHDSLTASVSQLG